MTMARNRPRRTAAEVEAGRAPAARTSPVDQPRPKSVGAFDDSTVGLAAEALRLARRHIPPQEMNLAFLVADKARIDELKSLARRTLEAKPKSPSDEEKVQRRELAHAIHQMDDQFELLEAIQRGEATQPEYEKYKDGFDNRLKEAMETVARLCSHELKQQRAARKDRPGAKSQFTKFFNRRSEWGWDPDKIAEALVDDARSGDSGDFALSDDGLTIYTLRGKRKRTLKLSDIRVAVAKAKAAQK
jgi:hypothetical protein